MKCIRAESYYTVSLHSFEGGGGGGGSVSDRICQSLAPSCPKKDHQLVSLANNALNITKFLQENLKSEATMISTPYLEHPHGNTYSTHDPRYSVNKRITL